MRVLWFGTYSVGTGYPRNTVLMDALRAVGVEVETCHAPLFRGAADKVTAASTRVGLVRFGLSCAARVDAPGGSAFAPPGRTTRSSSATPATSTSTSRGC